MVRVTFEVPGRAVPKGSLRAFPHKTTGKIVQISMGRGSKEWMRAVQYSGRAAMRGRPPIEGPTGVRLVIMLPLTKAERTPRWHTAQPDIDKLIRGVLDGLTGIVVKDDRQIARVEADKVATADPRVLVTVEELDRLTNWMRWEEVNDAIRQP